MEFSRFPHGKSDLGQVWNLFQISPAEVRLQVRAAAVRASDRQALMQVGGDLPGCPLFWDALKPLLRSSPSCWEPQHQRSLGSLMGNVHWPQAR
eukprot:2152473-Pyramimonas_sp.AAC.1